MTKGQRAILTIAILACVLVLLFPPVRSPDEVYARLKIVGGQPAGSGGIVGGWSVPAVRLSRFAAFGGVVFTPEHGPLRVEVDAGELLRELALIVVLGAGAWLWLPGVVLAWRQPTSSPPA